MRIRLIVSLLISFCFIDALASNSPGSGIIISDESQAITFIKELAQNYLQVLQNEKVNIAARRETFLQILETHFAVKSIAGFILGRYRKLFDVNNRERFYKIFKNMLAIIYVDKFQHFGHLDLFNFTATKQKNSRIDEYLVVCHVKTKNKSDVLLKWTLIKSGEGFKVLDISVDGISINVIQRDEIVEQISQTGDNILTFIESLESRYQDLSRR